MKYTAKDLFSDVVNSDEPAVTPEPEPEPVSANNFINDLTSLLHEINELLSNPNIAMLVNKKGVGGTPNVISSTPAVASAPASAPANNEVVTVGMIEQFLKSDVGKQTIIKVLDKIKLEYGDLTISQLEEKIMSGEIKW